MLGSNIAPALQPKDLATCDNKLLLINANIPPVFITQKMLLTLSENSNMTAVEDSQVFYSGGNTSSAQRALCE